MERLRCAGNWLTTLVSRLPFSLSVVDTTGAGDAFTAGLLHAGLPRPGAHPFCRRLWCLGLRRGAGGIDPQPTQAQVEAFLGEVS